MPGWKAKDERQFEHIKEGLEERGTSEARAAEIAARTVNKQRRQRGETPNKTTQGTGNPRKGLEERTYRELRNLAAQRHIRGRTKMNKADLIQRLRASH